MQPPTTGSHCQFTEPKNGEARAGVCIASNEHTAALWSDYYGRVVFVPVSEVHTFNDQPPPPPTFAAGVTPGAKIGTAAAGKSTTPVTNFPAGRKIEPAGEALSDAAAKVVGTAQSRTEIVVGECHGPDGSRDFGFNVTIAPDGVLHYAPRPGDYVKVKLPGGNEAAYTAQEWGKLHREHFGTLDELNALRNKYLQCKERLYEYEHGGRQYAEAVQLRAENAKLKEYENIKSVSYHGPDGVFGVTPIMEVIAGWRRSQKLEQEVGRVSDVNVRMLEENTRLRAENAKLKQNEQVILELRNELTRTMNRSARISSDSNTTYKSIIDVLNKYPLP